MMKPKRIWLWLGLFFFLFVIGFGFYYYHSDRSISIPTLVQKGLRHLINKIIPAIFLKLSLRLAIM